MEIVTTSFGIVLNVALASLIVARTAERLRAYSRVLLCNCVVDCLFATVSLICGMVCNEVLFDQEGFTSFSALTFGMAFTWPYPRVSYGAPIYLYRSASTSFMSTSQLGLSQFPCFTDTLQCAGQTEARWLGSLHQTVPELIILCMKKAPFFVPNSSGLSHFIPIFWSDFTALHLIMISFVGTTSFEQGTLRFV